MMKLLFKSILLIFFMNLLSCSEEEPAPEFHLVFKSKNKLAELQGIYYPNSYSSILDPEPLPEGGFPALGVQAEDIDNTVVVFISHTGELNKEIPIALTINGSAIEGEDFNSLPDTILYNPFDEHEESQFSIRAIDDLKFEGTFENLELTFSYKMNGITRSETIDLFLYDNDYRFELIWENEFGNSAETDLDLIMIRGYNEIFYESVQGEKIASTIEAVDISGAENKWKMFTGYGSGVKYVSGNTANGTVYYRSRFYFPNGRYMEYVDGFLSDDFTTDSSNSHLPMVVVRTVGYGFDLTFIYPNGQSELITVY